MTIPVITEASATDTDIIAFIDKLSPLLNEAPEHVVLISMLFLLLTIQAPTMTVEQIQDGVKETSRFICTYLDSIMTPEVDPSKVN